MTEKMLMRLAYEAYVYVKSVCPVYSRNMHDQIKLRPVAVNEWQIEIGGEQADYAVYTNEPWISPRWKGKQNPNEKWIDNAVENIALRIRTRIGGELSIP